MRLRTLNEVEMDVWPAFTDFVTSILFIVILFIFGILFSSIAQSSSEIETLKEQQQRVRRQLEAQLGDKIEIPREDGSLQRIILRVDEQGTGGVLFRRSSAELSDKGKELLDDIVAVLEANRDDYDTILVEGHTDDTPISGSYPSNWELSAARAGAVVNHILSASLHGDNRKLQPWRFSASGRAEYRPYGMSETEMKLDPMPNLRGGPGLEYVVKSNQIPGQNPVFDNPKAQRNRRIEIVLTYKVNGSQSASSRKNE